MAVGQDAGPDLEGKRYPFPIHFLHIAIMLMLNTVLFASTDYWRHRYGVGQGLGCRVLLHFAYSDSVIRS
jgi:hypothetical protein